MCKMMNLHLGLPCAFHDWRTMPLLNNASIGYMMHKLKKSPSAETPWKNWPCSNQKKRESHILGNMLGSWIEALQWYVLLNIGEDIIWNITSNSPQAASCKLCLKYLDVYYVQIYIRCIFAPSICGSKTNSLLHTSIAGCPASTHRMPRGPIFAWKSWWLGSPKKNGGCIWKYGQMMINVLHPKYTGSS